MATKTIDQVLQAATSSTAEREYIIDCLKEAVNYCKQQYNDSCIDWLPSADAVQLRDDDKFDLLLTFLNTL